MATVFIAYKKELDEDRAEHIRDALQALGVVTFIDRDIASGESYLITLNNQIDSAKAVLVLWSHAAVESVKTQQQSYFSSQLLRSLERQILVYAALDPH